ncbi:unnamed protein product [Prunus armeniaca]
MLRSIVYQDACVDERRRNRADKYDLMLRFRPYPSLVVFEVWEAVERMSSRSDLSDSQEMPSSKSAFRDDMKDEEVVEQMFEAADQIGEDMPIRLGRNFEYREVVEKGGEEESREGRDVARAGSGESEGGDMSTNEAEEGWSADKHLSTMT